VIFISLLSVHLKNSTTFFQSLFLLLTVILPRISFIFVPSCSYLPSIHWWIVNVESSYTTTCSLRATTIGMPSFVVTILDDVAPQILFNSWGVTTITVATTWFKQTQIVWEQMKNRVFREAQMRVCTFYYFSSFSYFLYHFLFLSFFSFVIMFTMK